MFEHYEREQQQQYDLNEAETQEILEIIYEILGITPTLEDGETFPITPGALNGLAMMSFRAGRSYQASGTDNQYINVRWPVAKAAQLIENLIAED